MSAADILAAIANTIATPKRARTDAGEVEQHDLAQQVAAAKFAIAASGASTSPFRQLRFAAQVAPNATGGPDPTSVADIYPPPGMAGLPGYPT